MVVGKCDGHPAVAVKLGSIPLNPTLTVTWGQIETTLDHVHPGWRTPNKTITLMVTCLNYVPKLKRREPSYFVTIILKPNAQPGAIATDSIWATTSTSAAVDLTQPRVQMHPCEGTSKDLEEAPWCTLSGMPGTITEHQSYQDIKTHSESAGVMNGVMKWHLKNTGKRHELMHWYYLLQVGGARKATSGGIGQLHSFTASPTTIVQMWDEAVYYVTWSWCKGEEAVLQSAMISEDILDVVGMAAAQLFTGPYTLFPDTADGRDVLYHYEYGGDCDKHAISAASFVHMLLRTDGVELEMFKCPVARDIVAHWRLTRGDVLFCHVSADMSTATGGKTVKKGSKWGGHCIWLLAKKGDKHGPDETKITVAGSLFGEATRATTPHVRVRGVWAAACKSFFDAYNLGSPDLPDPFGDVTVPGVSNIKMFHPDSYPEMIQVYSFDACFCAVYANGKWPTVSEAIEDKSTIEFVRMPTMGDPKRWETKDPRYFIVNVDEGRLGRGTKLCREIEDVKACTTLVNEQGSGYQSLLLASNIREQHKLWVCTKGWARVRAALKDGIIKYSLAQPLAQEPSPDLYADDWTKNRLNPIYAFDADNRMAIAVGGAAAAVPFATSQSRHFDD